MRKTTAIERMFIDLLGMTKEEKREILCFYNAPFSGEWTREEKSKVMRTMSFPVFGDSVITPMTKDIVQTIAENATSEAVKYLVLDILREKETVIHLSKVADAFRMKRKWNSIVKTTRTRFLTFTTSRIALRRVNIILRNIGNMIQDMTGMPESLQKWSTSAFCQ